MRLTAQAAVVQWCDARHYLRDSSAQVNTSDQEFREHFFLL
ncbi:hypothetical protein M3J09_002351 [Ascochyta lentis]